MKFQLSRYVVKNKVSPFTRLATCNRVEGGRVLSRNTEQTLNPCTRAHLYIQGVPRLTVQMGNCEFHMEKRNESVQWNWGLFLEKLKQRPDLNCCVCGYMQCAKRNPYKN